MPTSVHTYQKYLNPSCGPVPLKSKAKIFMFGELDVLSYGTWVNEKFLGQ
jgi:hypothetical protein